MSGWQIQYSVLSTWVNLSVSYRNVTGTPCTYVALVADRDEGCAQPLAGVYRFNCHLAFGPSASWWCEQVHSFETGNPNFYPDEYGGWRSTVIDDSTSNRNLLPGVSIVLSSGTETDDAFEIGIGCYWSTTLGAWVRPATFGPVLPGEETTHRTLRAVNATGNQLSNCKVVATNHARVENADNDVSQPFYSFMQTGVLNPTPDADTTGQAVTFANVTGGTCDILIDGDPIDVYDVTNATTIVNGEGLEADSATVYRFADGTALQSIEFVLSEDLESDDTATIYVSDGGESVEVAAEVGTWYTGVTGVELTEDGQADGVVSVGGYVTFYLRAAPGASEDSDLNPRYYSLRVQGVE